MVRAKCNNNGTTNLGFEARLCAAADAYRNNIVRSEKFIEANAGTGSASI